MSAQTKSLQALHPWTKSPIIINAPMYRISMSRLATAVTQSGGIGFIASGLDQSSLLNELSLVAKALNHTPSAENPLPVGVGFVNWGSNLEYALEAIEKYIPAAVWFFAPRQPGDLKVWSDRVREASKGRTAIWVQVGTVAQALQAAELCNPDVLVVQGSDAGGHGTANAAGIITLLPEVADTLQEKGFGHIALVAAGGISEGRGVAAATLLGAQGVVLGTRFIACAEAEISNDYQRDVLAASDGGQSTVRNVFFDELRGPNEWPAYTDGRGLRDQALEDSERGMSLEENRRIYKQGLEKGDRSRVTRYAGTGVGLVREVLGAREIVEGLRRDCGRAQENAVAGM